jgi:heme-degrading monooxygenase HmoA
VTATFRVLLRVEVRPGLETDFEGEWRAGSEVVAGQPANRGHWLSRSDKEDSTYYVVSDWTDEPSFRAFESSPAHLEHRQRMHPYRTGGSMTTMRIVAGASHPEAALR